MNRTIGPVVGVVLGCLVIFGAIMGMRADMAAGIECGGSKMRPGDICEQRSSRGKTTWSDYSEMETSASIGPIFGIGFGSIIVLVAGVKLYGALRDRKRAVPGHPPYAPGQPPRPVRGTWGPRQPPSGPQRQRPHDSRQPPPD